MSYDNIAESVSVFYENIDRMTEAFRAISQISCPEGCGSCCASEKVEAAEIELLPLAKILWSRGEAEARLLQIADASSNTCVFYSPNELCYGQGRCSIYPWRPLVCRLFGFAAVRLKTGCLEMTICALIRKILPDASQKATSIIESGFNPIVFSDAALELRNIDPNLGKQVVPINEAARRAIERIGFERDLQGDLALPPQEVF